MEQSKVNHNSTHSLLHKFNHP